jgi:hypothetical protein
MAITWRGGKLRWKRKRANRGRKPAQSKHRDRLCKSNK